MKKQFVAVIALAGLAAGATLAHAASGSKGGGIVGSKHDMNVFIAANGGKADTELRVCAFCHTPHHAKDTQLQQTTVITDPATGVGTTVNYTTYLPLWSRDVPAGGYSQYNTSTFDPGADGKFYDPMAGPSRLCMTCHDGNIAVDSYYGQTGAATKKGDDQINMFASGSHFAIADKNGSGLTNDHPVGFVYDEMVSNPTYELRASSEGFIGNATRTIDSVLTYVDGAQGRVMTCASCHDVHNGPAVGNTAPASGNGYFLYATQEGSKLCLSCHDKNR
ncbi:cytochrome c3 family protein [Geomonas paludis]|uniref:Cytochrome c n=1 Tax=Geomonas paludis TaxID=2740185 RepID=A0A6V8MX32_9BACT|nr:cytochrome c3 family protein [Geomonas paludis]UPU37135.1 cytochrome c3 family protein [Geomonas paludis]GFO64768.1 cytochrome c [Geomonas paludis]